MMQFWHETRPGVSENVVIFKALYRQMIIAEELYKVSSIDLLQKVLN